MAKHKTKPKSVKKTTTQSTRDYTSGKVTTIKSSKKKKKK